MCEDPGDRKLVQETLRESGMPVARPPAPGERHTMTSAESQHYIDTGERPLQREAMEATLPPAAKDGQLVTTVDGLFLSYGEDWFRVQIPPLEGPLPGAGYYTIAGRVWRLFSTEDFGDGPERFGTLYGWGFEGPHDDPILEEMNGVQLHATFFDHEDSDPTPPDLLQLRAYLALDAVEHGEVQPNGRPYYTLTPDELVTWRQRQLDEAIAAQEAAWQTYMAATKVRDGALLARRRAEHTAPGTFPDGWVP